LISIFSASLIERRQQAAMWIGSLCAAMFGGCATPAVELKVPTMSVPEAWNASTRVDFGSVDARITRPGTNAGLPYPVISAPDIRLAYIKPWRDEQGNRHFGSWVAIQVEAPRWVSPDGTLEGITPRSRPGAPAAIDR